MNNTNDRELVLAAFRLVGDAMKAITIVALASMGIKALKDASEKGDEAHDENCVPLIL